MSLGGKHGDIIGRAVGMLVFLGGIALLGLVFAKAFDLFGAKPADALGLMFTGDPKKDPSLTVIGAKFTWMLFRVAYLFIMAIAGSLISQRGINLYFSAVKGHVVDATAKISATPPVS